MATGQNLDEHIEAQEIAYLKKNEKLESRKANFKKRNIVFGGIFLALIVVIFALDLGDKNDSYNSFKDVNITDTEKITEIANSSELLGYADLYSKYENAYLGNRGFHSLNYGLLAENQYGYTCLNENNQTVLNANGKETIVNTEPISQVNIANNKVIYRGADRKLYSSNYDGTEKANIVNDNVGTVLLVGKDIYYVNYSKGNNLYKYSLEGQEPALVLEANIKTFTIVADTILYLDYSNNLYLTSFQGVNKWTLANVNKFYFNGRVRFFTSIKELATKISTCEDETIIRDIIEDYFKEIEESIKEYKKSMSDIKTLGWMGVKSLMVPATLPVMQSFFNMPDDTLKKLGALGLGIGVVGAFWESRSKINKLKENFEYDYLLELSQHTSRLYSGEVFHNNLHTGYQMYLMDNLNHFLRD